MVWRGPGAGACACGCALAGGAAEGDGAATTRRPSQAAVGGATTCRMARDSTPASSPSSVSRLISSSSYREGSSWGGAGGAGVHSLLAEETVGGGYNHDYLRSLRRSQVVTGEGMTRGSAEMARGHERSRGSARWMVGVWR